MELKIEYLDKKALKPYARNAKIHDSAQVEQIKESIRQFQFNGPIAVYGDNVIVEGHGRLLAVMEMDEIETVPVIRLDHLSDEQRRAYALVHNKLTMNSPFDIDMLTLELEELEDFDIDMSDFGFDVTGDGDDLPAQRDDGGDGDETSGFNYTEQYGVIVMCADEAEQEEIYNHLTEEGYTCKVVAV